MILAEQHIVGEASLSLCQPSTMHPLIVPMLLCFLSRAIAATCYYRNGSIAYDDTPCSDSPMCCRVGDACMTNGLCRDRNNHPDGSLTLNGGHEFNFTGLYSTASCQEESFQNCSIQCSTCKAADPWGKGLDHVVMISSQIPLRPSNTSGLATLTLPATAAIMTGST